MLGFATCFSWWWLGPFAKVIYIIVFHVELLSIMLYGVRAGIMYCDNIQLLMSFCEGHVILLLCNGLINE